AELRGSQVRLAVAQSNADLQGESFDLLRTLFENGRATRLDLERAEAQFRATLSILPQLEASMRIAAANLVTLTGQLHLSQAPLVEMALNNASGEIPAPPDVLEIETPEAMIRRRPDVRAAEREIAERLALGEAERARLFPTITFNANLLSVFNEDNDLGDSFGFAIGPAIRWDGPDLRRVRADIEVQDAQTKRAVANYESVVVQALGEVESALIGYAFERARRADLEAAAESSERAASLARLRFEEGLDDFLDVIDAQRAQLESQDRLEISRLETTRQAIFAYRALGGIWTDAQFNSSRATGDMPDG
ncbi:MAG: TolC family protein, partial [Pseudomonadota bacterium]